jgi:hypothetical protein
VTTLRIDIDDATAEAIRNRAQRAGKTPEAWAAELIMQQAVPPTNKKWIEKFLEDARESPGNSGGWKWNREELYDR